VGRYGPPSWRTRLTLSALSLWWEGGDGAGAPSIADLATATRQSERAVRAHLERAAADGWIVPTAGGYRPGNPRIGGSA
jgi:hypothetical protein